MIRHSIRLERAHGWQVECFFAVTHYDVDEIMQALAWAGADTNTLERAYDNLDAAELDTGLCFSDNGKSVLVVSVASSAGQFLNSICHEVHHLSTHIAAARGYDLRGEEVCYIAGEVAEAMFPAIAEHLCDCCKKDKKHARRDHH